MNSYVEKMEKVESWDRQKNCDRGKAGGKSSNMNTDIIIFSIQNFGDR